MFNKISILVSFGITFCAILVSSPNVSYATYCTSHFDCGIEGSGRECVDGVCTNCATAAVSGAHYCHELNSAVAASVCGTCPTYAPFFRSGAGGCTPCEAGNSYHATYYYHDVPPYKIPGCRGYCGASAAWQCQRYGHYRPQYNIMYRCPVGYMNPSLLDATWRSCTELCPTDDNSNECDTCPAHKPYYRKKTEAKSTGPVDQYFCTCCRQADSTDDGACPEGGICKDFEWTKTCNNNFDCMSVDKNSLGYECVDNKCVECDTTWTINTVTTGGVASIIDHTTQKTCGTCPVHAPFWRYDDHNHASTTGNPTGTNWTKFSGCVPCSAPKNTGYQYYNHYWTFNYTVSPYKAADDLPGCRGLCGYTGGVYPGGDWSCMQSNQGSWQARCPIGMIDKRTSAWTACQVCPITDGSSNTCNSCPATKPYYRKKPSGEYFCTSCHTPSTSSPYCDDCDEKYVCQTCPTNFESDGKGGCRCINHFACGAEGSGMQCVSGDCVACPSAAVSGGDYSHETNATVIASTCPSCPPHAPFYRKDAGGCTPCSAAGVYWANIYPNGFPNVKIPGCRGYCNAWSCRRYAYNINTNYIMTRCPVGMIAPTPFDQTWRDCDTVCPFGDNDATCSTCPSYKPFYRRKPQENVNGPIEQYFCTCCRQADTTDGGACPSGGTCTDFEWSKDCTENYECGAESGYECVNGKCTECDTSWTVSTTNGAYLDQSGIKTCGTCPPHAPFWRYDDHNHAVGQGYPLAATPWTKFSGCVPCAIPKNTGSSYYWYYHTFAWNVSPYKTPEGYPGCRGLCGYQAGAQVGQSAQSAWMCLQVTSGSNVAMCPVGMVDNRTGAWTVCNTLCPIADGAANTCNTCPAVSPYYRKKPNGEYFCSSCHTPNQPSSFCGACDENYMCTACPDHFEDPGDGSCACTDHFACGSEGSGMQCISGKCVACPSVPVSGASGSHETNASVAASTCGTCPTYAPFFRTGAGGCTPCESSAAYHGNVWQNAMPSKGILGCRGYCGGAGAWICSIYAWNYNQHHIIARCPVGYQPPYPYDATYRACSTLCPTGDNTTSCGTCPSYKPYFRKKTDHRSSGPINQYFCTCCKQANTTDGGTCPSGGTCTDFEYTGKDCSDNYDCGAQSGYECVNGKCTECDTSWTLTAVTGSIIDHAGEKTCGTCPPHAPFWRYDDHSHTSVEGNPTGTAWPQFAGCVPCSASKSTGSSASYWHYYPFNNSALNKSADDSPGCRGICGYQSGQYPGSNWACMQLNSGAKEYRCPVGIVDQRTAAWTVCGPLCDTNDGEANTCNSCPVTTPYYRMKPNGEYFCSSCHTPSQPSSFCGECDADYTCLGCPENFIDDGNGRCLCANHHACGEGSGKMCVNGACVACPSTVISGANHSHDTVAAVRASVCPTCPPYAPYYRSGGCQPCDSSAAYYAVHHGNPFPLLNTPVGCRGYCSSWVCSRYNHGLSTHGIIERCPVGYDVPLLFDTTRRNCTNLCPTNDNTSTCDTCPPHKPYFRKKTTARSTGPLDQYFCTCCKRANSTNGGTCPDGGTCTDFEYTGKDCSENYDCGAESGYECVDGKCTECDTTWTINFNNGAVIDQSQDKTCGTCPIHAPFWRYDDHTGGGWSKFAGCVPCSAPKNTGTAYYWHSWTFSNGISPYKTADDYPGCRGLCGYYSGSTSLSDKWQCMQSNQGSWQARCPVGIVDARTGAWTKCGAVCSTSDGESNTCNSCPYNKPYYRKKPSGEYLCTACHTPSTPSSYCGICDENYVCLGCPDYTEDDGTGKCRCISHHACGEGSGRQCNFSTGECEACPSANVGGSEGSQELLATVRASTCGSCPTYAPFYRAAIGACSPCSTAGAYWANFYYNGFPGSAILGCRGYCNNWQCQRYAYPNTSYSIMARCPVGYMNPIPFDAVWRSCTTLCDTTETGGECDTCPSYKPFFRKKTAENSKGPVDQYFCTCCKQANSTIGSTCPDGGECVDFEYIGKSCSEDYDCGAQSGYECVSGTCTECDTTWTVYSTNAAIIDQRYEQTCGTCPIHAPFWRYDDHFHVVGQGSPVASVPWTKFSGCVPCSAPKNTGASYSWHYYTFNYNNVNKSYEETKGCRGLCGYTWGGSTNTSNWQCNQLNSGVKEYRCPIGMVDTRTTAWKRCDTLCPTSDGAVNTCNSCPYTKPYYRIKRNGEYFCSSCHTPNQTSSFCDDCDEDYVCQSCPKNFGDDGEGGCYCLNHHACIEGSGKMCVSGECVDCPNTIVSGAHHSHDIVAGVRASICPTCPPHAPYFRSAIGCTACDSSGSYYAGFHANSFSSLDTPMGCRGYCGATGVWLCSRYNYGLPTHDVIERCPVGIVPDTTFDTVRRNCGAVCPLSNGSAECPTCPSYKPFYRKKTDERSTGPIDKYFCTCCKQSDSTEGGTCPDGGTCKDFEYTGKSCSENYDCGAQNGYECVDGTCVECSTSWTVSFTNGAFIDQSLDKTCGTCPPHAPFWRYDDHTGGGRDKFSGCVPCSAPKNTGTAYSWYYHTFKWDVSPYKTPDGYPGCRGLCGYTWGSSSPSDKWQCNQITSGANIAMCPVGMVDNRTGAWTKCATICPISDGEEYICNTCPSTKPYYRVKQNGEYFCTSCHTASQPSEYCSECDENYVCGKCPENFKEDGEGGCICANHHACGEGSGKQCDANTGECVACPSVPISGAHYSEETNAAVRASVCGSCPTHSPYYRTAAGGCTPCEAGGSHHATFYPNDVSRYDTPGCRGYCGATVAWQCQRNAHDRNAHGIMYRCPIGFIPPTPFDNSWRSCVNLCPTEEGTAECQTCPSYKPYYRKKAESKSTGPIDQYFCTCCNKANSTEFSNCPDGGECVDFEWIGPTCKENYDCGAGSGLECVNGQCVECDTSWTINMTNAGIIDHFGEKTCGTCPPHAPFWRHDSHNHEATEGTPTGTTWPKFAGCVPCSAPRDVGTSYSWHYYPFNYTVLNKSADDLPGCRGLCGYTWGTGIGTSWQCMQSTQGAKEYRCPIGMVDSRTTAWTRCNQICSTADGAQNTCNTCPSHKPYYRIKQSGEYFCAECHTPGGQNGCPSTGVICDENYECNYGGDVEIPDLCTFDSDCGAGFKCTGDPKYCAECSTSSACGSCNCGSSQKPDGNGACVNTNSCCTGSCNLATGANSCSYSDAACSGVQQCQTSGTNAGSCCGSYTPYWKNNACKPCTGTSGHTGTCDTPGMMCNSNYECVECTGDQAGCIECYTNSHCSGIRQCRSDNKCCPSETPYWSGSECLECLENRHCSSNICQNGECKTADTVDCGMNQIWYNGECKDCPSGASYSSGTCVCSNDKIWNPYTNTCVDSIDRDGVSTSDGTIDTDRLQPVAIDDLSEERYNRIKSKMTRIIDTLRE
ncbi:MAG: hypothetical protein AB7U85_00175 [Alphaproteobacteria bacterium]